MDYKLLLFFALIAFVNAEFKSYKDYKVYKIIAKSEEEVQLLTDLQKYNQYVFWSDIIKVNGDTRIMVDPANQNEFERYLSNVNMDFKVAIEDVQNIINEQMRRPTNRVDGEYTWEYYQTYEELIAWIDGLAELYPDIVTVVTLDTTYEGRVIRGVKIDYKKQENPIIGMIEGGIHAREWISPATVTGIINAFLTSDDENIRIIAENIVWHIFPVTNPDGYAYTFTNDRMWRKNRNPAEVTTCSSGDDNSNGADLNRNFGYRWNTIGASSNPCDITYAGPVAFSEIESRAISNYVLSLKQEGTVIYYIAFHSYSQLVLVPYSHTSVNQLTELPANYGDLYEIAVKAADKLQQRHGIEYVSGTSQDILYSVSGSSFDWVKGVAEVPIVYLFELRDTGDYGFLLPPEQIIPNNEEIIDAIVELDRVTRLIGYYHLNSGSSVMFSVVTLFAAVLVNLMF